MTYEGEYHVISGDFSGGSAPPPPHVPAEADDTLSSKQSLKMLFAIGEGEIESIDNVYVNGTPFSSFEGTLQTNTGTLTQGYLNGFHDVETPFSVGVVLVTGVYITRSVSSSLVDSVRVTLKLQGLSEILANGDRVGYAVQYLIETRPVAGTGTYSVAGIITKKGKTSTVYGWDVRVNKPAGATGIWEFRVVRNSAADTAKQASITTFDSYTEIQDKKLAYPGTALAALTFTNADQLGGRIPTISFDVRGIKMKVPDGAFYNVTTKIYTGVWNGAFDPVYKYTDNPAWFIYNLLTNDLDFIVGGKTYQRGLGIQPSLLDPFSFYELGKYCDEFISDGKAGTEPRFTINNQFYVRENAPKLLAMALTICNANLTNQNGLITIISDRPTASTKLVTNDNVINGDFSYPSSHVDERYTFANVTYNDPDDKSNSRTVSESASQTLIDRYGFNAVDIVLVGCRSEGQARRKAKWVLQAPTQIVNFRVGLAGALYNVGEVVEIYDNKFTNFEGQGLIAAATTTQITLDRPVTLAAQTYTIMVYGADGVTILEKIINQSNGTFTVLTMSTALASVPIVNSPWILKGAIVPRKFKIAIIEREDNEYKISGTQYDPNKFASIESGIVVTPPAGIFSNIEQFVTEAPVNITFQELFYSTATGGGNKILVKWDWDLNSDQKFQPTFDVIWRRDNLPFVSLPSRQVKEAEILDTVPGIYEVIVYAINIRGIRSLGAKQTYSYRVGAATSTLIAPENFWVKGTVATSYNSANLALTWTYPLANDNAADALLDYVLEVWTSDGVTKKATYIIEPNASRGGEYIYTLAANTADFGGVATRVIQIKLYSRDRIGDVSTPISKNFTNPVPAAPVVTILSGVGISFVDITPPSDPDVTGYIVYRDTVNGFTPGPANLLYDGPDTYVTLEANQLTTYYYRVAAYDTFAKTGLNIATQQTSTTLGTDATTWTLQSIVFTPNSPSANQVAWTAGTVIQNGSTTYNIVSGNATWTTGFLYIYFNPGVSTTVLQSTTSLATAVAQGTFPIATYQGGTLLKGGDGSAFISGSQIIAGTVGASQLITGSAVITGTAQIANSIITNSHIVNATIDYGKISDTLQSTNFSLAAHTGWKLTKGGGITVHDLTVLDSAGNTVLASGSKVDFANLTGATKPANNATVGAQFTDLAYTPGGPITLVGNATISTNTISKNSGVAAWDTQAYSTQSFTGSGGVSFKFGTLDKLCMGAINSDPTTDASFTSLDFAIFANSTGILEIYESGVSIGVVGTFTTANVFQILYSGTTVTYLKDGIVFRTVSTSAGRTFYFDSSLSFVGAQINSISIGSVSGIGNIVGTINPLNASTYISNAAINTAHIADANITTLKLAGQAVTIPVFAHTEAAIGLVSLAEVVVQTLSINSTGAPIQITSAVGLPGSNLYSQSGSILYIQWARFVHVRLYRDGFLIQELLNGSRTVEMFTSDQPGAGTHTYELRVYLVTYDIPHGVGTANKRSLSLMEVKR